MKTIVTPEAGALSAWILLGILEAQLRLHDKITVDDWNECVADALRIDGADV